MRNSAPAIALALGVLLAPKTTHAQEELDERARLHFQAATSYFEAAQYEDALREFEQAYRLSDRVALLYNIAITHERLGHWNEAADFLERYIDGSSDLSNREVLELKVRNLRERAERDTGTDTDTGTDARTGTDTGTDTGGGPDAESPGGGVPTAAIVTWAAAGVGAILWATFGALAIAEDSRLSEDCAAMPCTDDDVGTLRTFDLVADVSFGVTLAAAALGTIFFFTMRDGGGSGSDDETGVRATATTVAPWIGPEGAGLALAGRL